jgi:hypothetical protein
MWRHPILKVILLVCILSGELADGVRNDGRWIHTSLVRDDTGAGACEVMLVTEVRH